MIDHGDEEWVRVRNNRFKARVRQCLEDTNPENRITLEEVYRTQDEPYRLSVHYIFHFIGGRNGGVAWSDYTKDLHKMFKALHNRNKCHFLRAWLLELKNGPSDRFDLWIGARDEEVQYPPLDPSTPRIIRLE